MEFRERIQIDPFGLNYEISDDGTVYNMTTNRPLKPTLRRSYMGVSLSSNNAKKSFNIHRLVALSFLKKKDGYDEVNHINGNKFDNRMENLEWTSSSENTKHALKTGLMPDRSLAVRCLTREGNLVGVFTNMLEASKATGANSRHISCVCKGKRQTTGGYRWEYVDSSYAQTKEDTPKGKILPEQEFNNYLWTADGRCYSKKAKRFLKGNKTVNGHYISCSRGTNKKVKVVLVHRIVAKLFISNPENHKYVIHLNGDILDNRVENLKWEGSQSCNPKLNKNKTKN